jgi:hypothetical protein
MFSNDDWPGPPDFAVKTLDQLAGLRGKPIWIVSHNSTVRSGDWVGLSDVHISKWACGPILVERSPQATYSFYNPGYVRPENFEYGEPLLTENGDWGNAARRELTVLALRRYLDTPWCIIADNPVWWPNGIFTDLEQAELWAVQVKLSFNTPPPPGKFRGFKETKFRRSVRKSLGV